MMHDPTTPRRQELPAVPVTLRALRELLARTPARTPLSQVAAQLRELIVAGHRARRPIAGEAR